jgi:DNA polymerase III subunit delta'
MTEAPDLWAEVVGQDSAVAQLRAAVAAPGHAYLLVGPPGSGRRAAARAFAADLLSDGLDGEATARARRLAAIEQHPAMEVVERTGPRIDADQAREVVRRAGLAPAEGSRQVIVLVDVHLVREAGAILLKSVEEPVPSTVFVLLAEELPPDLATIASRCVQVRFGAVPEHVIVEALVAEGADLGRARAAAAASGNNVGRARLLVHDDELSQRRAAWASVPERLDGSGATAAVLVDELLGGIDEVLVPLQARQAGEREALEERLEALGVSGKGELDRLAERHKREARRVRTEELLAGLAALAGTYREALVGGGDPAPFLSAAAAVQRTCDALVFNPTERLALQALLVDLPRSDGAGAR